MDDTADTKGLRDDLCEVVVSGPTSKCIVKDSDATRSFCFVYCCRSSLCMQAMEIVDRLSHVRFFDAQRLSRRLKDEQDCCSLQTFCALRDCVAIEARQLKAQSAQECTEGWPSGLSLRWVRCPGPTRKSTNERPARRRLGTLRVRHSSFRQAFHRGLAWMQLSVLTSRQATSRDLHAADPHFLCQATSTCQTSIFV